MEIYLGEPPSCVKEWIRSHHKQDQFNFLYKKEGDAEWQECEPQPDDIQLVDGKATVNATSFKSMDGFADVREVKLPNKWNNGTEDVDVTNIGDHAFSECSGLTSVTFDGNAPTVGTESFDRVASGCKAVISSTATGFPAAGETWNGLIVEAKS